MGLFRFLGKSKYNEEDSLPQNDTERWLSAAYAIWSEYCGGSFKYIGGFEKNRSNASMVRGVLNRDWLISNKDCGVSAIDYILQDEIKNEKDEKKFAFNYTCAINISGRMYVGGYITREEYVQFAIKAARKLQQKYHSWEEFCRSYIEGTKLEPGVADETEQFLLAYQKLMAAPVTIYQIDWNLKLQE